MARTDTIQNGHGPHRPDHWSALPWRPYASRAPLDTTADASVFHASMLRRELRRWLDADVTEHVAGDIILAAYEAIAEIVALADPLDAGLIRMQAHLDDDQVRVVISYTGSWEFSPDPDQSQRRLTLIRVLTDHASFHRDERTITVHLTTYRQSPPQAMGDGYPSR